MKPKVLLVTTNRWLATARLAMAFRQVGIPVDALAPSGHPLHATSACSHIYRYHGLAPMHSLRAAILASAPQIVIPCDDLACSLLHRIHAESLGPTGNPLLARLVELSLGDHHYFPLTEARSPLMQLARAAGIRAPETAVIESLDGLRAWVALYGLPAVLKADGTCGGRGVRIAGNPQEAEVAFQQLNSPPELLRTVKRSVFDQDWSLLEPCLRRTLPTVNIQRFVPGPDATITVACWQGEVLASIAVEVLKTCKPKGPASVVQLIVNPEMQAAAEILVHRLGLSGLLGFDFVLDQATGTAHLIEMNPRATPTAHLALGTGRDLPAALGAAMLGAALPETESITARDRIALFPSEWLNDSASRWLQCAYHDVPWAEPRLVNLGVKNKLSNGGRLTYDNLTRLTAKYLPRRR